jgi:nitrite reductase (NO-forming)
MVTRRRMLIGGGMVAAVALAALGVFAVFGGFDEVSRERVGGAGPQVVEVRLVDQGLGFDVRPDVVEVELGTHLVLDVVNRADGDHDLAVNGGPGTDVLAPGQSQRLDLGVMGADGNAWCTLGDHRTGGMTLDIRTVDSPRQAGAR